RLRILLVGLDIPDPDFLHFSSPEVLDVHKVPLYLPRLPLRRGREHADRVVGFQMDDHVFDDPHGWEYLFIHSSMPPSGRPKWRRSSASSFCWSGISWWMYSRACSTLWTSESAWSRIGRAAAAISSCEISLPAKLASRAIVASTDWTVVPIRSLMISSICFRSSTVTGRVRYRSILLGT